MQEGNNQQKQQTNPDSNAVAAQEEENKKNNIHLSGEPMYMSTDNGELKAGFLMLRERKSKRMCQHMQKKNFNKF